MNTTRKASKEESSTCMQDRTYAGYDSTHIEYVGFTKWIDLSDVRLLVYALSFRVQV